jgi:hypothetical protein
LFFVKTMRSNPTLFLALLALAGIGMPWRAHAQGLANPADQVQVPANTPDLQAAPTPPIEDQNGPLHAAWNTDRLRTGDPLQLRLSMTVPPGNEVLWPDWTQPPVEGLELMANSSDTTADGITQSWAFQHFDTGVFQFPPQAVSLVRDGDTISFATQALDFRVSDVPFDTAEGIRPIIGPRTVTYRRFPWFLVYILAALAVIIAGFVLYQRYAKRKTAPEEPEARPAPRKPVDEHALERLRVLEKKRLWQQGQVDTYYVELADILREYVEFRYNVPALESPTGETLQRLSAHDIPAPSAEALSHALRLADTVKFARANPLTDQHQRVFRDAEAFVEATKPQPVEEAAPNTADQTPAP